MNKNIPGVSVPDPIIQELEKGDVERRSIDITIRLVRELKAVCSGVHIMMTTPWHDRIPHILDEVEITGGISRTAGATG
jgi:5,10-methylenetetrahydrofolate reductase